MTSSYKGKLKTLNTNVICINLHLPMIIVFCISSRSLFANG